MLNQDPNSRSPALHELATYFFLVMVSSTNIIVANVQHKICNSNTGPAQMFLLKVVTMLYKLKIKLPLLSGFTIIPFK